MAKEYNITRAAGQCAACGSELQPQQEFTAAVREADDDNADEPLVREDYCMSCWASRREQVTADRSVLGIWQSRVPAPKEKKKTFVNDEVLIGFFERLEGADEPAKVQFRFVLALILMRKKVLVYDGLERGEGDRPWRMHFRGSDKTCAVVDPHMDEDKIAEVSHQLGEVLEGDL